MLPRHRRRSEWSLDAHEDSQLFPSKAPRPASLRGAAIAVLLAGTTALRAQDATQQTAPPPANPDARVTGSTTISNDAQGNPQKSTAASRSSSKKKKQKVAKDDRVQQGKDTKAEVKREEKARSARRQGRPAARQAALRQSHGPDQERPLRYRSSRSPDAAQHLSRLAVHDALQARHRRRLVQGGRHPLRSPRPSRSTRISSPSSPTSPRPPKRSSASATSTSSRWTFPTATTPRVRMPKKSTARCSSSTPTLAKALTDEARQKLREVQEVLAEREAELGAFYGTHANWAASIARYQTVIDTYPLYSHMDDVLIGRRRCVRGGSSHRPQPKAPRSCPRQVAAGVRRQGRRILSSRSCCCTPPRPTWRMPRSASRA